MTISEARKKSNKFVADLDVIIEDIVNYNEDLEMLNKKQLRASQLATGRKIPKVYSPSYAAWKSRFFPQSFDKGEVNLFLTGKLFANLEIKMKGMKYQLISLVSYASKLIDKYTNDIFGISPKNQPEAQRITSKLLLEEYKKRVLS